MKGHAGLPGLVSFLIIDISSSSFMFQGIEDLQACLCFYPQELPEAV